MASAVAPRSTSPPGQAAAAHPAAFSQTSPQSLVLTGRWTALDMCDIERGLDALPAMNGVALVVDASGVAALDTAGAWVIQRLLRQARQSGGDASLGGLPQRFAALMDLVTRQFTEETARPAVVAPPAPGALGSVGRGAVSALREAHGMVGFVGEIAESIAHCIVHPTRWRWRPVLFNIRTAGFDALPIVGLLAFLLGVVVAYQGSSQLRQYGANIFVADLVGISMLREFAPLITAIIVAGRSGSAYAAQIGTMAVTEEIDAMQTLGIDPQEMLVLPKVIALMIALPLLTVFADVLGVFGGMVMARQQLDVGFVDFLDRFVKAVVTSTALTGIGKAPVFAAIIAVVGCYQGFRTRGGADSVGRQTTRSVVQSIFLVIVADALFSIVFSALDL
ncbi:MlaE family lipid ABC transporter permease subunit [Variovorax sp. H27-G14]|uniref:ABC transporter permease n=1 Tax=Variovorax sp. H27-G14 TaxID=3111914 RepID=UPI0038FCA04C